MSNAFAKESATQRRLRSRFLLELALDQERLRARIADKLRDYTGRDQKIPRVTQPEMARRLGVSLRQYQRWEAATLLPRWGNLERIAEETGIAIHDLLGEPPDAEPTSVVSPAAAEDGYADAVAALREEIRADRESTQSALEQLATQLKQHASQQALMQSGLERVADRLEKLEARRKRQRAG